MRNSFKMAILSKKLEKLLSGLGRMGVPSLDLICDILKIYRLLKAQSNESVFPKNILAFGSSRLPLNKIVVARLLYRLVVYTNL